MFESCFFSVKIGTIQTKKKKKKKNQTNIAHACLAAAVGHALPAALDQKILVFHFGGGTFDASVLDYTDGNYEVKATITDFSLGVRAKKKLKICKTKFTR